MEEDNQLTQVYLESGR